MMIIGSILFGLGALVTALNVYRSFLRYPIHRARGGARETYRWISGIPLFGSLLLWVSIGLLPTHGLKWLADLLSIFDTGGVHWFMGTMLWTGTAARPLSRRSGRE